MFLFNWFTQSIARQISILLVLILSVSTTVIVFYFYTLQTTNAKNSTVQMAEQLLSSLNSASAKSIHFNDGYNAWINIKNELKNNIKQIEKGGLFHINEIALLDKTGDVFAHSSPENNPLKMKYKGTFPDNLFSEKDSDTVVFSWFQIKNVNAVRLYRKVIYQQRVVGVIILQIDLSILQNQQQELIKQLLLYFLFAVIISISIGVSLGRWFSYPVLSVEKSLDKMGTGKLLLPDLLKRKDEFRNLAQSIEQIDKALFEGQSKIALLLDSTAEAIYGIDTNGNCTFVNQACLDMLGYQSDFQLLDKNMHELIHYRYSTGEDYPEKNCNIFKAFRENTNTHIDDEVLWRQDGSSFPAEYWSHPIIENNQCVGAVVTFINITKRIESEKTIRESEKNLAITLNSIGDAVIATDPDGNVTRMNPAAEDLTGWLLSDAQGLSLKSVFKIIDVSTRKPIDNPVDKVIETGETIYLSNHTTLISKDETEYQISDSAAPIKDKDNIIGMVLVFNDVTKEYKLREIAAKSKRDLQAIMDHSPAVIYVKDIDSRFIFINQQFSTLFHLDQDDVIGKSVDDIFPKDIADEMRQNDLSVITSKRSIEFEEHAQLEDGIHTYVSIKFPLFNEEGEIYAVCGISTDITERQQQEEQLRRTQKMDALGKLTGGIAHDYNNMLGIVLGYAEQIIETSHEKDNVFRYATNILHAAKRGTKLTKKLLGFTRNKQPSSDVININSLLLEQKGMLEKVITVKHQLSYKLQEDLWFVGIDSSDLEDALINMCINSIHSMESNGRITIDASNVSLDEIDVNHIDLVKGDYVLLSITDTGCGMNSETRDKVFDPFYTTKGDKGTGLGLSQVYGFVKRSGGSIKIYSEVGKGTRIVIFFPRSVQQLTVFEDTKKVSTANLTGTETILVVDDEPVLVELANDIFTAHGYKVLTASDGIKALSVLEQEKVQLIVSDVIMPNMDGYQLAEQVCNLYPEIKILMVSGFADERHKQNMQSSLHTSLLHKPYSSQTILKRVRELLNSRNEDKTIKSTSFKYTNILIMDDDDDAQELYKIRLNKINCNVISVYNAVDAISSYKKSLAGDESIDIVILDLSIPGGMSGVEVADELRKIDLNAKIIVASGNTESHEMLNPKEFGFDAAIEKSLKINDIKNVFESLLNRKLR